MNPELTDTIIKTLGEAKIASPVRKSENGKPECSFQPDEDRVLVEINTEKILEQIRLGIEPASFEKAGPRSHIFFDPSKVRCAIVTCGGLCPGLNDIIRAIVLELTYGYGVRGIYGIRYGLAGFIPEYRYDVVDLTPAEVEDIHGSGGTVLGSSRGPQDIGQIVDCLERMNVGILFTVGGDGTLMASTRICDEIAKRGLKISVVGIPKTIDNDIFMVGRSFGFETAVEMATAAIRTAHTEAVGYPNGIGLVKLMGRHSGFIAAHAALAQQDVNFVLVPEVNFDLEGENGFLKTLETRLLDRGHAVVVAAEGAGQKFFEGENAERDASGNLKLHDIGMFLKSEIARYFDSINMEINLKFIDPSYMIRSHPANSNDNVFCSFLARNAVHAGMAGKTRLLVGYWHDQFVHVPMDASAGKRKRIDPNGRLWMSVQEATGQRSMTNAHESCE
ncbi:Pyrophosphate-fructose 6-phosphate 1-phosphotransferase [Desulfatibacillum aliphaticivorans]|uniref:ATP-dependent 6-phosphofructokinase n=1 Tax=Desulfatibacillum aliphaticivorans TaxID=218208 RepID=B8FLJ0_DESAL|nr:ATP-dependent 6-phosphofructokinase [Desulfatibacillum aliphaticivorans]ACL05136.1 Pyrophosphate-fructose 6-phosphate 1-phosphotransferase [Desulfatibacillum aliphaticivorans]